MRKPNAVCLLCSKDFYARPSNVKSGGGKYCTWKCYSTATGKIAEYPQDKQCPRCGDKFTIYSSRKRNKKFCTKSCASKANNELKVGKKYNVEKEHKWTFKDRLVAIFGHKCCMCPYDVSVDGHHIKRVADGGDNSLGNGILLCPNHHREVHLGLITDEQLLICLQKAKSGEAVG